MEEVFDVVFLVENLPRCNDVWWCKVVAVFIVWVIIK